MLLEPVWNCVEKKKKKKLNFQTFSKSEFWHFLFGAKKSKKYFF